MFICGAIDDLYQKNARFSKWKFFFSMRSIRLSTVYSVEREVDLKIFQMSSLTLGSNSN